MVIKSDRKVFIGAHLTPAVKAAVKDQAKKLRISMSQWVFIAAAEKLERADVDVRDYEE